MIHMSAVKELREAGVDNIHCTNRDAAEAMRVKFARSGKIASYCRQSLKHEASQYTIIAYGFDELDNVVAVTTIGTRQFI